MLCCRFNTLWEFFVLLTHEGFSLPSEIPSQYQNRITYSNQEKTWCLIKSAPHEVSTRTSKLFLQKSGIWICEGDCESFGGISPCVFGIPLTEKTLTTFETHRSELHHYLQSKLQCAWITSRVSYHGTSHEHYLGICAQGFKSSFGMLGTGVYLGSFWKACRFAARDQEYKFRDTPTVIRIVWTCKSEDILHFPRKIMYCLCSECYLRQEQKSFCGHTLDWQTHAKVYPEKTPREYVEGQDKRYYAGYLKPCKFPNSEKFITQNEEWVVNPSCIHRIAESVVLNLDSVEKPFYNPLQRNIQFL